MRFRPASTASLNASAISAGFRAVAIAVFIRTASAPISIAAAAWEGKPRPASIITGTLDCSIIISSAAAVLSPWLEPMDWQEA